VGIPGPAINFLPHALRWWDHWLKGQDTGIMEEPKYRVWMQDYVEPDACLAHVPGQWVTESSWPSPNIQSHSLFLNQNGLGKAEGPKAVLTHSSPQTLGATGGSWCPYGLGGSSPDLAIDQREDDGRSLCFDSEALAEPLALLGAPLARLRIAVDKPFGFLAVRLCDVAPDGISRRVSNGLLNLTHAAGHEILKLPVPGEWFDVTIQLNDFAHRFAAGHRIRLAISTAYWPMVWPSPETVTLSLEATSSKLELPCRAHREEDEDQAAEELPEMAPLAKTRTIEPARSSRKIARDLSSGLWREDLVEDGGAYHIDAIDLDVADGMTCSYSIAEDDPLSAVATWNWHSERRRGDWNIRIETSTKLRATEAEFLIDTDVEASENGILLFTRAWRERIARDGV
jgi:predicted acyl esterase